MKVIIQQLVQYYKEVNKPVFISSTVIISLLIFINYHWGLNRNIVKQPFFTEYILWYFIFLFAFTTPYLLHFILSRKIILNKALLFLIFLAPAIFAWKLSAPIKFNFSSNVMMNAYWNMVAYYPIKFAFIAFVLFIVWKGFDKDKPFYGWSTANFYARPYLIMLVIMVPLIVFASTQPDFLALYPKLKNVQFLQGANTGFHKVLYELSYGSDFLSIELFFRGFLILAFAKWVGKDAILPMAMFYCTIHFGKPLGECISSFFGGLILGVVTFHSQTIWGGVIVHLGIAWLMEIGGYLGNYVF